MKVRAFVQQYDTFPGPERKAGLSQLRRTSDLETVLRMTKGDDARAATRVLCDLGPRITQFVTDNISVFLALLENPDPKVRMNTAQIIGQTCAAEHVDELAKALDAEGTMYARPSFLLAIGSAKTNEAREYLEQYTIRSDLDKHIADEKEALNKALSNFVERKKARVRVLSSDVVLCSTPNKNITHEAFRKAGFAHVRPYGSYIAVSGLEKFSQVYKVRAYDTAYIYLGSCPPKDLPKLLESRENAILQRTQVTGYRLEVKGVAHEDRVEIIRECIPAMKTLVNTPSSYSIEIMIDMTDPKNAKVLLNTLTDPRFTYRKKTVPASISCGTAACLMSYASEFFDPDARVLDDFCGAGTLLFERGYYPHHTLTGVDLNLAAIEAAKINSSTAIVHPQFHHVNALHFTAKRYSEIVTNLPFGIRVGNHAQNEQLYRRYFAVLPDIVTKGALVVLYTHEKRLTEHLLEKLEDFDLLKKTTFDSGGLYPAAYVLRSKRPQLP